MTNVLCAITSRQLNKDILFKRNFLRINSIQVKEIKKKRIAVILKTKNVNDISYTTYSLISDLQKEWEVSDIAYLCPLKLTSRIISLFHVNTFNTRPMILPLYQGIRKLHLVFEVLAYCIPPDAVSFVLEFINMISYANICKSLLICAIRSLSNIVITCFSRKTSIRQSECLLCPVYLFRHSYFISIKQRLYFHNFEQFRLRIFLLQGLLDSIVLKQPKLVFFTFIIFRMFYLLSSINLYNRLIIKHIYFNAIKVDGCLYDSLQRYFLFSSIL